MSFSHQDPTFVPGYDLNAKPFVPSSQNYQHHPGVSTQFPEPPSYPKYPYTLKLRSLPSSVTQPDLEELINSIVDANFDSTHDSSYNIVSFALTSEIGSASDDQLSSEDDSRSSSISAVLQVNNWDLSRTLLESLNGFEWLHSIVDAKLSGNTAPPPTGFVNRPGYYNPYFSILNRSYSGIDMASSSSSPSTNSSQSINPPIGAPSAPTSKFIATPVPTLPANPQGFEYPPYINGPPWAPPPSQTPYQASVPTASLAQPRFLSRRSSSNRSFDSRKNSRNSSSSGLASHKTSISSTSSAASAGNAGSIPKQPVPPFIINMVKSKADSRSPSGELNSQGGETSEDEDFIYVKNQDTDELIKVNAFRLFIGNVPYSSTWAHLKHFLIARAKEINPRENLSILRVEIPMQAGTLMGSYDRASGGMDDIMAEQGFYQYHVPYSKSRGFAIVTTGDRETSEKLIQYFDNCEFEGRTLTVRYDRFPEYNNYVLQQLHPSNSRSHYSQEGINGKKLSGTAGSHYHGTSVAGHLAFERNVLQQKFYSGPAPTQSVAGNYMMYPYFYNNSQSVASIHSPIPLAPNGHYAKHNSVPLPAVPTSVYGLYQPPFKPIQEPFMKNKVDRGPPVKFSSNTLATIDPTKPHHSIPPEVDPKSDTYEELDEDEKARDLVNCFEGVDISK